MSLRALGHQYVDEGEVGRHGDCDTKTLGDPRGDQQIVTWRDSRTERAKAEQRQPNQHAPALSKQVRGAPRKNHEAHERHGASGNQQRKIGIFQLKCRLDRRQGDRENRKVRGHDQLGQAHQDNDQPIVAVRLAARAQFASLHLRRSFHFIFSASVPVLTGVGNRLQSGGRPKTNVGVEINHS